MINRLISHLALCALIILCTSCKKNESFQNIDEPGPGVEVPNPPKPPVDTVVTPSKVIKLGTGSGNLNIDGKTLNITGKTIIKIQAGSYERIQISNLLSNTVTTVQNDGLVELVGSKQMVLSNLKNVVISGNGTKGISRGFVFRDRNEDGAAILLNNDINDLTIENIAFKNLKNYSVIQYNSEKVYNGSENSYSKNLKFLNLDCDNTGTLIRFRGNTENSTITGLVKNIEIAYTTFINSRNVGSMVVLENADSYDVHNNFVQNINQDNKNHNGVFYLQGNGKFYNNMIIDHQGNGIRAWGYSIGTTPKPILIFNNIVANSKEYSAFEIQSFARNIIPGKTTYINAKVFNNTCGNLLNHDGTFPAQVLDIYSLLGGKCEVFNNLSYKLFIVGNNNTNYAWNDLGDTKATGTANKYASTYTGAGIQDDKNFNLTSGSLAKRAGAAILTSDFDAATIKAIGTDYHGKIRNTATPSVGAVE